jgi:MscS family membrane protein
VKNIASIAEWARHRAVSALILLGFTLATPSAWAQDIIPGLGDESPPATAQVPALRVPAERASPRATFMTFLGAMNDVAGGLEGRLADAVLCLDLSEINPILHEQEGTKVAVQLREAVDHLEYVHARLVPNDPEGAPWTFVTRREGRITLARSDSGEWLFTPDTVSAAPLLFASVKDMTRLANSVPIDIGRFVRSQMFRDVMPASLQQTGFLLEHWQWLALLALVFVGVVADKLAILALVLILRLAFRKRPLNAEHRAETRVNLRPFGLVAMSLLWLWGITFLDLPHLAHLYLVVASQFVLAVASVWGSYRLTNILGEFLTQWADRTESTLDDLLVPLVVKSLKLFITALGIIFLADRLAIRLAPLLTGLGLGGLAFALAAKDFVGNLFGSVMVITDGTFQVGDWVVIGDIEGTIEQVGFRSTRIRTFYNSLITLPNSNLITSSVDNLGRRRYRRWRTTISVTYDTPPGKIEAFCEGIRELVRRHPYTRKDYFQVYLTAFAPASLDVLLYIFFSTPDWSTELRERQRLMLDIMRLAQQLGVEFAFPTQTLHVVQDNDSDSVPDAEAFMSQREVNQASLKGRKAARDILAAFDIDDGSKPPPVRFDVAREENRGEAGDG